MILQVHPVDFTEVSKVQDAAQSYTKADGEVVKLMLQKPALLLPKKCYMLSALIKVYHGHTDCVTTGFVGCPETAFLLLPESACKLSRLR